MATDDEVRRALAFYQRVQWGRDPLELVEVEVADTPAILVKMGDLVAVTYRTAKGTRSTRTDDWEHHFKRPLPVLGVDPETERLHIVGGRYRVLEAGITG